MPRTPLPLRGAKSTGGISAHDRGRKFVCYKCSGKFYDLNKPAPVCPKCGADQREQPVARPAEARRSRLAAAPKVVPPVEPAAEPAVADEDAEVDELEEEDEA